MRSNLAYLSFVVTLIVGLTEPALSGSGLGMRLPCTSDGIQFGKCCPGKDSCRECHYELVVHLLGDAENVFNLTEGFFPPNNNSTHSMIINYRFYNETVDELHSWFWAQSAVHYLFPMVVFQFLSCFFGKPEPLYQRKVMVTLDATDCLGVSNEYMALLTQRVSHCPTFLDCSSTFKLLASSL